MKAVALPGPCGEKSIRTKSGRVRSLPGDISPAGCAWPPRCWPKQGLRADLKDVPAKMNPGVQLRGSMKRTSAFAALDLWDERGRRKFLIESYVQRGQSSQAEILPPGNRAINFER